MVFTPLNEESFDKAQVEMGYCKMFKHIVEDFVTRKDCAMIMNPSNLQAQVTVFVPVTGVAGPVAVAGTAQGTSNGIVKANYKGEIPSADSNAMIAEKETKRRAGGAAVAAATKGLS